VPAIVGLDHVLISIPADGEAVARDFYGGLLDLTEVPKPPALGASGCWFVGQGVALHLGVEEPFVPARKAHAALHVDDLVGLRSSLDAAGVETFEDDRDIGVRRFYAYDPFGNRLELVDRADAGFTDRQRENPTG
jgi:catechol 2,3-dioxygenase-like lactoylglutathione lyase family enzyme